MGGTGDSGGGARSTLAQAAHATTRPDECVALLRAPSAALRSLAPSMHAASAVQFVKRVRNGVEFRYDPLTRHETRINPARARRPKQGETADSGLMEVVARSKENCVFCPERIQEKVPRFDAALKLDGGRVHVNETLLFPNLNPFGEGHAVAVFSHAHFLSPAQFAAPMLRDAFKAAHTYFVAAHAASPRSVFPTLVWNYMPPSAGSIIHPHIQLLLEETPVPALDALLASASAYAARHGRSYFADLVAAEQAAPAERYLGAVGGVHVLASFAPRGTNELLLVVPGVASLFQLTDALIADLAQTLALILPVWETQLAVGAFNLASYSAPGPVVAPEVAGSFSLHFKLFARPAPRGLYTSDTGPMERVYDAWVIDAVPERLKEVIAPALAAAKH